MIGSLSVLEDGGGRGNLEGNGSSPCGRDDTAGELPELRHAYRAIAGVRNSFRLSWHIGKRNEFRTPAIARWPGLQFVSSVGTPALQGSEREGRARG